jgi:hypothetical protein
MYVPVHIIFSGLKTQFRGAVQQAREVAGHNTSSQAASNAPSHAGAAVPALVVSLTAFNLVLMVFLCVTLTRMKTLFFTL